MSNTTRTRSRVRPSCLMARAGAGRKGFTLIEMLVAVGAVTLIALGVSQVFRATGGTIRAGRRLSNLNAMAAQIQHQFQADINAMTRDGFLIIRHEEIRGPNNAGVKLFDDTHSPTKGPGPRIRRSDELLFFAHGDFTSLRSPVDPRRIPRATAARIYYGMGLHWDPADPGYLEPVRIGEHNSSPIPTVTNSTHTPPGLGLPFPGNQTGPNLYAADWTLLRHAALLIRPDFEDRQDPPSGSADRNTPANPDLVSGEWTDNEIQVGFQLAASSAFYLRAMSDPDPAPVDAALVRDMSPFGDTDRPMIGCGAVDIIAMDLGTIRSTIMSAGGFPTFGAVITAPPAIPSMGFDDSAGAGAPTVFMHAWMRNALPCNADGSINNVILPNQPPTGGRMRCEKQPPNYLGEGWPGPYREYRKTDQLMLSASNFVPACTEFIVEWSFGKTYPVNPAQPTVNEGQLIWHGIQRFDSPVGNTLGPQRTTDRIFAEPYHGATLPPGAAMTVPFRTNAPATPANPQPAGTWPVSDFLIHDFLSLGAMAPGQVPPPRLYSYFGYVDPTFDPDRDGNNVLGDPNDSAQDSIPWAWPSLIRITMNLVDPSDPSIEQTFQFVFKVPVGTEAAN